jgi:hypothetical protein
LPGKKIKNYRLSVLNGKDQQKNEKDDYGDQFSTHLLSPLFLLSFHPLEGTLSLVENLLRALCLISQAMTQLFFEHKEITYPAHPIDTFHDGRRALSLRLIIHSPRQGNIPFKSINADADSSQDIIVKELCLHLRRNQIICLFVISFSGKKCWKWPQHLV